MVYDVKNKVVLITGAATGIGAEVVKVLVENEAKHVAILDIAEEPGIALQNELNAKYGSGKVKFYKGDVTKDDQLFGAFKSVADSNEYIDIVINNAGIMNDSLAKYKTAIEVNVTALVTGTLKALETMRKDEGGRGGTVINISSIAGISQTPHMPIYWGTKAAVIQFSNCIGLDEYYIRTGVRVVTICFGATITDLISPGRLGSFDKKIDAQLMDLLTDYPRQSPEAAARGVLEVIKQGESASTWLVTSGKPAEDITPTVKKAYGLMEKHVGK